MINLNELSLRLHSVTVMRSLLEDEVVKALMNILDKAENTNNTILADNYCTFVHKLYDTGCTDLTMYIKRIVFESENIYVRTKGMGCEISEQLKRSLAEDLITFDMVAEILPIELKAKCGGHDFFPEWTVSESHIYRDYMKRVDNIDKFGYGMYAKYRMFYIDKNFEITPVQNHDSTMLEDLVDYKREQKIIMDNTRALLCGKPAANILLTGDAGTGKSSTIKAVVNELYKDGLRIIEIRKEQLHSIPAVLDELNGNPLKFILFIDDLSFTRDDDNFSALKAILEGSVSAKSKNVVIYATSNRRHLVKEKFSDREGDDVHFNDTMQEILSLSERFGIRLTFQRPDKATYLDIVHALADKSGIRYDDEKLDAAAEKFALKRGSRSARAARQFTDWLVATGNYDVI